MRPDHTIGTRYLLRERVGRGGMGEVWRAVHLVLDRPVAIKIVLPGLSSDATFAARFEREAKIAASLDHPGITTVYDFGEDDGRLYVVMEWLDGSSLDEVVAQNPHGFPIDKVLDWTAQITDALAFAHARQIVHRDIKPANLMLRSNGKVKVCDFGIARSTESTTITLAGQALGTPAYMAPEQWRGRRVDGRADLYSLGCVVYEMLTGRTPFPRGQRPEALMYQHLHDTPPPPRSLRPDVPERLEAFTLRLLAKEPDDRPSDATAVAGELAAMLAPPPPPPPTAPAVPAPALTPAPAGTAGPEKAGLISALDSVTDVGELINVEPPPHSSVTDPAGPTGPAESAGHTAPPGERLVDAPVRPSPGETSGTAQGAEVAAAPSLGVGGFVALTFVCVSLIAAIIVPLGFANVDVPLKSPSGSRTTSESGGSGWTMASQQLINTVWDVTPRADVSGLTGNLTLDTSAAESNKRCKDLLANSGVKIQWAVYLDGVTVTGGTLVFRLKRHWWSADHVTGAKFDNSKVRGRPFFVGFTARRLDGVPCPVTLTWVNPGLNAPGPGPWFS